MQRRCAAALGYLCLLVVSVSALTMLGGPSEAKIDEHTHDVAKYAVSQLNAKANFPKQGTLEFSKVVSAKKQVS